MLVSDFDFLLEGAGDYEAMFRPLLNLLDSSPDCPPRYKTLVERVQANSIMFARNVLRRSDRGIWFLRYARRRAIESCFAAASTRDDLPADVAEKLDILDGEWRRTAKGVFTDDSPSAYDDDSLYGMANKALLLRRLEDKLRHFMGIDCPQIQNYRFGNQSPLTIIQTFEAFEAEWKKARSGEMKDDGAELLIRFPDGMAWYDSKKPKCPDEGDAMGHCGNQYGWKEGDTILSLRRKMSGSRVRPSLTFILDKDGYLGETKGRENAKPNQKYHSHILALLLNPIVKGIKGGGWQPENNFEMKDLTDADREALFKARPDFQPALIYFKEHGCDDKFRLKALKEIEGQMDEERPSDGYKPHWVERNGEWILAFKQVKDWVDELEQLGDRSISDAVAFPDSYTFEDYVNGDGSSLPKSFPDQWQDALLTYFAENAPHEMVVEFFNLARPEEINDLHVEDVCDFLSERDQPRELSSALDLADVEGVRAACKEAITNKLKTLCNLGHMNLDPFDNGYFWCTPEQAAIWASGASSDDIGSHNTPSFPDDMSFYLDGYDMQIALAVFHEIMGKKMHLQPLAETK